MSAPPDLVPNSWPPMKLTLWLVWRPTSGGEDCEVTLAKDIDRPYGRVPAAGELVLLGDDPHDLGLAWPVESVMWSNSGRAALTLMPITAEDADLEELMDYGFADTR